MSAFKKITFLLTFFILFSCKETAKKQEERGLLVENSSSKSKNVFVLKDYLSVKNLEIKYIPRNVWLYLPPNYEESNERYPVIYIHDGQNLFDKKASWASEWGVDKILNDLFKKSGSSFVLVEIENVGNERINEYSPWTHKKYGGGSGDNYLDAIVTVLKPTIDKEYRIKGDAEYIGIIRGSMGV